MTLPVTPMTDDVARRRFWAEQMEAAHVFMQRALQHPIEEGREPLVSLCDAAREHDVRIEFSGEPVWGPGLHKLFTIRRSLVPPILRVAQTMLSKGWLLRVEDAYRSRRMQTYGAGSDYVFEAVLQKVSWELAGAKPTPEFLHRRLGVMTATVPKLANHMAGSTVDISVLKASGRAEVDRGGYYPEVSENTPMASPFVSPEARRNREAINEIMGQCGFVPYPYEFWHYSHGDVDWHVTTNDPAPARYGPVDCDVDTGAVTPVTNPTEPMVSVDHLRRKLERVL